MADGGVCPLFDAQVLNGIDYSGLDCFQRHGISLSTPGDGLKMRPLERSDFSKGYKELLSQLTVVGDLTQERFEEQFDEMRSCPGTYYVVVIEDTQVGRTVCSATLLVERKFIHCAAMRGRIEDVVVEDEYRGRHLGALLLETLTSLSKRLGCYKTSLDCKAAVSPFYKKFGYTDESVSFLVQRFRDQ